MNRKNITYILGINFMIVLFLLFVFDKITWWHLAILLITLGIFLILLFNFDNVTRLLIQRGEDKIILEMNEIRSDSESKQTKPTKKISEKRKIKTKDKKQIIEVAIFDKKYLIRVLGEDDRNYIENLVSYVDQKMHEVAVKSKSVDKMKISTLAALNLADELFIVKKKLEEKKRHTKKNN